jgi:hypothetical protein
MDFPLGMPLLMNSITLGTFTEGFPAPPKNAPIFFLLSTAVSEGVERVQLIIIADVFQGLVRCITPACTEACAEKTTLYSTEVS